MRAVFVFLSTLIFILISTKSHAVERNCRWDATHTNHDTYAGSQYNSFTACSLFIRSLILGSQSGALGSFGDLAVGSEFEGTVTYVDPNGSKRICKTKLRKPNADRLNRDEYLSAYIHAEMTGTSMSIDQQQKATEYLKKLDLKPEDVIRKIDESLILECEDSVS